MRAFALSSVLAAMWVAACASPAEHGRSAGAESTRVGQLIESGDYQGAERTGREIVASIGQSRGEQSAEYVSALDALVRALLVNGRGSSAEARELANRAVRILEDRLGANDPGLVSALQNLGNVLGEDQQDQASLETFERALRIRRASPGTTTTVPESRLLIHLSLAQTRADRFDDGLASAEQSLQLLSPGDSGPDRVRALQAVAQALQGKGEYASADAPLKEAVSIRKRIGTEHPDFIETLSLLSYQETANGRLEEARDRAADAMQLAERRLRPDHPQLARAVRLYAITQGDLWDLEGARADHRRALSLAEKAWSASHSEIAAFASGLAGATLMLGEYEEARRLYERVLAIREAQFGAVHDFVATATYNLALVDASLGDYDRARQGYQRAVKIWEEVYGPNHPFVAQALAAQALAIRDQGHPDDALPLLERSLRIREKALGPEHRTVARTLTEVAATDRLLGRIPDAQRRSERALRIWAAAGSPDAHDYATAVALSAELALLRGDVAAALRESQRAMSIEERVFGAAHPEVAQARMGLARSLRLSGDLAGAMENAREAEVSGREHLRLMLRSLPERQALAYAGVRPRGVDLLLSLVNAAPGAVTASFDAVIRSRALVLDEVAGRRRVARDQSSEVAALVAELSAAQQRSANLSVRGPGSMPRAVYEKLLAAAMQVSEGAERRLAEKSTAFKAERTLAQAGLSEVEAALPHDAALVSFVRYRELRSTKAEAPSYVAFVIRSGGLPKAVKLGEASSIEALVSQWRQDVTADLRNPKALLPPSFESGAALRARIWDPVARLVDGADALFVVMDGSLALVPLAALPTKPGAYLVETAPRIHYLTAERDVAAMTPRTASASDGMLALGGPDFDDGPAAGPTSTLRGGTTCGNLQSIHFTPLDGTVKEVEEVAALWPAPLGRHQSLLGRDASEPAFKRDAHGYRVLHLATHGFFLDGSCLPASMPRQSRGVGGLSAADTVDNPLRLSGLALAGANRRSEARPEEDDGILTAEEVAALDLHGVEWAVLSACDTGVGEIKAGEGVFGLRRAFQVAGARTVIMSLWSVDDQATRAWMRALYQGRFQRQLSTADAVHQASLTVLRDRRARGLSTHPFFWAAFVAAGDWR